MAFQPLPPVSPVVGAERRTSGPIWNTIVAAVVGVLVLAYIVTAAAQLVVLNQAANDLASIANGTPDFTRDDITTLVSRINTVSNAYLITFWAMLITFIVWNAVLRSNLKSHGQTFSRRTMTAWKVWRVGVLISIVMVFVAQSGGTADNAADGVSFYHRQMAFYAVRLLIGAIYLWVVFSVWRAATAAYATVGQAPPATRPLTAYEQAYQRTLEPPVPYGPAYPYGGTAPYGQAPAFVQPADAAPWAYPQPQQAYSPYPAAPYVPPAPTTQAPTAPTDGTTVG